jgi:glyoxylase-like metal-dependent hydrolase (beta-lactamase superfamily II)
MLGLNMQDLTGDARDFIREFRISYPNVRDQSDDVAIDWGVAALPETFFIDARGRVLGHVIGAVSGAHQFSTSCRGAAEIDHGRARVVSRPRFPEGRWRTAVASTAGLLPPGLAAEHDRLSRPYRRAGGAGYHPVARLELLSEDRALQLPGRPGVMQTPGHTAGHCSVVLAEREVLFSGDAMVNFDYASGRRGPALHRFNEDRLAAQHSLARLESVEAEVILFGHGDPWTGGTQRAAEIARSFA